MTTRTSGFADVGGLLPIGGEMTDEIDLLDKSLVLVAKHALAVDKAGSEGMWRTWMLDALVEAERVARAAAALALKRIPADRPELRAAVERRCDGLDAFLKRYPGRPAQS
jgi:hypothetical protein